jgi:hypothetical protein
MPALEVQVEDVPLPASVSRHMPHGEVCMSVEGLAHSAVHEEAHGEPVAQPHSLSS